MADRDYYDILELKKGATDEEIKKAYRRLARQYHPDVNKGDQKAEARFKEISEAYAVLSDKDKRAQYDRLGREAFSFGGGDHFGQGSPFPGFDFDFSMFGGGSERKRSSGGARPADFRDIFSDLFSGQSASARAQKGADIEARVTITLRDAIEGKAIRLDVQRQAACTECRGLGNVRNQVCHRCAGTGARRESTEVKVRLPAGVADGQKIRVKGKGSIGGHGGPPGDLFVIVKVKPHPFFERRGEDIHIELPITIGEALGGAEVDVPTIHGPVRAKIPAGTQSGRVFRVTGKGVRRGKNEAGDHYYKVMIHIPEEAAPDLAENARKIEEAYKENPRAKLKTTL